ncbi:MAG: NYN domain-containing protein [Gammaproteobacteria bacterium]|nr:NYN domain-containing protein [Gammaproteobacteria bacterium]MBU1601358.1 NYN domain-containing protein [Gammaproteobacteria bacterium]MBU2433553.1 NYN domain-containing protein [Gammaproteobacteria bacterium]MBU2449910.1 NYN domain-containing protein [Gammaproteobacteria bacterium]
MAAANDNASMALFCDFENVALGVRDANYEKFDIKPILERLLAKGSIVVKKAYCDWDRYKAFKSAMHEANFELIEIPHVRQSGKNSADIRMVVDALDLCYTKAHVDTFVIISGDSDFSPLVSKLRENAKKVIGVGVKQSCSDLLVTNCDEFIYYDDLVRDREGRGNARRDREAPKRSPEEEANRKQKQEERKTKAVDLVTATFVDLMADRGESERIWASVLKEVVKRRNPGFNESYYGFRTFGNLLEEAASRGLLGFGRDDKGAFVFRAPARQVTVEAETAGEVAAEVIATVNPENGPKTESPAESETSGNARRRGGRRSRNGRERPASEPAVAVADVVPVSAAPSSPSPAAVSEAAPAEKAESKPRRGARRARKDVAEPASEAVVAERSSPEPVVVEAPAAPAEAATPGKSPRRRGGRTARQEPVQPAVAEQPVVESPASAEPKARKPRSRKPAKVAEES